MSEVGFYLVHLGWLLALALGAWGVGRRLLGGFDFESPTEQQVFAVAAGLAVLSYLVLLLGLCGLLYRPTAVVVLLSAVVAGLAYPGRWRISPTWAALAACAFAPLLLLTLYPPTHFDAILYHLPHARAHAQAHQLTYDPFIRFPAFPQTQELLFTFMLLVGDDLAAQGVQALMTLLVAVVVFSIGSRVGGRWAGVFATALWLAHPLVLWLGSSCYVDAGLTLYVVLACRAFSTAWRTGETRWFALAGALTGLAAASKHSGLLLVLILGSVLLIRVWRAGRPRLLVAFTLAFLLPTLPWYARAAYHTGDPLHPFLTRWLSSPAEGTGRGSGPGRLYGLRAIARMVDERDPTLLGSWLIGGISGPPLARAWLVLLPLAIGVALRLSVLRPWLAIAISWVVLSCLTCPDHRFLLPVMPLVALAEGVALAWLLARLIPATSGWRRAVRFGLAGCLLPVLAWPAASHFHRWLAINDWPPARRRQREAFLVRHLPVYPAFQWLHRHHDRDYSVYVMLASQMNYHGKGRVLGDWFGQDGWNYSYLAWPNRAEQCRCCRDGATLFARLRQLGVGYFLATEVADRLRLPDDDFYHRHFHVVDARADYCLHQLSETPAPPPGPELLGESSPRRVPVQPGQVYRLACHARAEAGVGQVYLEVRWFDREGQSLHADVRVVKVREVRRPIVLPLTAPGRADRADVSVRPYGTDGIQIDSCSFRELYASGNERNPGARSMSAIRRGTP